MLWITFDFYFFIIELTKEKFSILFKMIKSPRIIIFFIFILSITTISKSIYIIEFYFETKLDIHKKFVWLKFNYPPSI